MSPLPDDGVSPHQVTTPTLTVFAGIETVERELIRERTGAGRGVAKRYRGRCGRPKKMPGEPRGLTVRLLAAGTSVEEGVNTVGVYGRLIDRISDPGIA